jgi:hypothetical protein
VEALIGILCCALVAGALSSSLGKFLSFSSATERQLMARNLCQEMLDNVRDQTWVNLTNAIAAQPAGGYVLIMNNTTSATGTPGPLIAPRQLGLDQVQLVWSAPSIKNRFNGNCVLQLQYMGIAVPPTEIKSTATITWGDSRGNHTTTATTTVSKYGIHN